MTNPDQVMEATEGFATDLNGQRYIVVPGQTRVKADHELVQAFPQHFRPIEDGLTYGLEAATADPGEVRNRVASSEAKPEVKPEPVEPPKTPLKAAEPKATTAKR